MSLTPMMNQYLQVKEKCKDCILFFRLGDFYEMFFDDAQIASRELELVLTGRDCGLEEKAPMCGIPYHAANIYIGRLVNKGYKIAICEQLEDPALAKGIVERGIIKIITPGTFTDSTFLEDTKNNYIMSLFISDSSMGICYSDISTGDFYCTSESLNKAIIMDEISKFNPSEILIQEDIDKDLLASMKERFNVTYTFKDKDYFLCDAEENVLKQQCEYDEKSMTTLSLYAINGLLSYIYETQKLALSNINKIEYYNIVDYLSMDINTRRNLELTETMRDKSKKGSLLWVLDKTSTAMGARVLRKWIEQPLIDKEKIDDRLDALEELINNLSLSEDIKESLKQVYDIERIVGKISSKSINAKEMLTLKSSIEKIPYIKKLLSSFKCNLLSHMYNNLDELSDIYDLLDKSIYENPSLTLKEGNLIKDGYNADIDELRSAKAHGKEWIAALENNEREVTGIRSLKVGYNKVFGYYIEISKANFDLIPEGRYIRKQTLANAERYITPELKEMEEKILGAEEKLTNLEYEVFVSVREIIEKQINRMKKSAKILSELDCIQSFAQVSLENNYCKPNILKGGEIKITEGRHPVIERIIQSGTFVSNDTILNHEDEQLLLITGPNMAGKSTYMRQIALIVIMAQIGCYVPAKAASISICDKIFTRIGASDDLASGKSTFMVEMWEVANILKNATERSLVLLDEVGRGTSTYDGLSIAWSVVEYMCRDNNKRCKTLFATHYHELTKLEGKVKGVKNYSIAVKKIGEEIAFLRKIVPHSADESYGIEVAKLAGLPKAVTDRAKEILKTLETKSSKVISKDEVAITEVKNLKKEEKLSNEIATQQINFVDIEREQLINYIKQIDILNLTPMQCMNLLNELVNKAKGV